MQCAQLAAPIRMLKLERGANRCGVSFHEFGRQKLKVAVSLRQSGPKLVVVSARRGAEADVATALPSLGCEKSKIPANMQSTQVGKRGDAGNSTRPPTHLLHRAVRPNPAQIRPNNPTDVARLRPTWSEYLTPGRGSIQPAQRAASCRPPARKHGTTCCILGMQARLVPLKVCRPIRLSVTR